MAHGFYPAITILFILLALILNYIFHKKENKGKWQVIGLVGNNVDTRWKNFNKHNPKIIVTPCQEYFPRDTKIPDMPMDDKFLKTYLTTLIDLYETAYDKVITNKKKYDCIFIDRATIHGLFINLQIPNNLEEKAYWDAVEKLKTSIDSHSCGAVRKHILVLLLIVKCTKSLKHGGKLIFDNKYLGKKHFNLIKACFKHEKKFNDTGNYLDLMANKNNIPNFVELSNFRPEKAWLDNFKQYVVQNGVENNDLSNFEKKL